MQYIYASLHIVNFLLSETELSSPTSLGIDAVAMANTNAIIAPYNCTATAWLATKSICPKVPTKIVMPCKQKIVEKT